MSEIRGKVGDLEVALKKFPSSAQGRLECQIGSDPWIEVEYSMDSNGVWIEFPHGVFGFDLTAQIEDGAAPTFRAVRRGYSDSWEGHRFSRKGEEALQSLDSKQKKGVRVRAQMPGKIVRVMAKTGAQVQKNEPLLVMEAMKMENEIRAPLQGKVGQVKVAEGQAVDTGADLLVIDTI